MKREDLTITKGPGTMCSECDRAVPISQPVLLVEDPADGEILGFFHRFCITGAERLARERPGELDLIMVYLPGAEVRN